MEQEEKTDASELVGCAVRLTGLVDYQKGSIVSRTIVDQPAGTVTLFAFDEGQALIEHTAPFDALVLLLDGKAEISIEGKAHHLGEGDMLIMPAGKPHAVRTTKPFKMLLVMIRS